MRRTLHRVVARDLLLYAMQNMQDMEIVGHVHDEVIIECTPDVSVEQVCELMGQTPEWQKVCFYVQMDTSVRFI